MYATGHRSNVRPLKEYMFLARPRRKINLAMSGCPDVRLSVTSRQRMSDTIRSQDSEFGTDTVYLPEQ